MSVVSQYKIVHVATVFRGIQALGTLFYHQFLGGVCSQAAITRIICFLFHFSTLLTCATPLTKPPSTAEVFIAGVLVTLCLNGLTWLSAGNGMLMGISV